MARRSLPRRAPTRPDPTPDQIARDRATVCLAEIRDALARHRCTVIAHTVLYYDRRGPELIWDVEAMP